MTDAVDELKITNGLLRNLISECSQSKFELIAMRQRSEQTTYRLPITENAGEIWPDSPSIEDTLVIENVWSGS